MTNSARQTVETHMAAVADRDLDTIVAMYAPDAVIVDGNRIGRGRDYARTVHAELLDAAADLRPELEVLAAGDVVYVSWRSAQPDGSDVVGSNTFVVTDGLVTVNTSFKAVGATRTGALAEVLA